MKKTQKSASAGTRKSQTPRVKRHGSSNSKPVTIDLKAETVDTGPAINSESASKAKASSSNVKPKEEARAAKASPNEKTEAPKDKKQQGQPSSEFGRDSRKTKNTPTNDPKPTANSKKTTPPQSSLSLNLNRFAAALIGGCVALAGAGLAQYLGLLGSPGSSSQFVDQEYFSAETQALRKELEGLKNLQKTQNQTPQSEIDIAAISKQIDDKIANITPRFEAKEIDKFIQQVKEASQRVEQLSQRQNETAASLQALGKSINAGEAGEAPAMAALNDRIESLSNDVTGTSQQIADLKKSAGALATSSTESLSSSIASIQQKLDLIDTGAKTTLADLEKRLEAGLQLVAAQAQTIALLQERVEKPDSSQMVVARTVAAAALKNDIDAGRPFTQSLEVLRRTAPTHEGLEALKPYADAGVATEAQLYTEFQNLSGEILEAVEPKPDPDLGSRLVAGMRSFVKVKPRTQLEGTSPIALVSQITAALEEGDLQAASDSWQQLPAEGQATSKLWHDRLAARLAADQLMSRTLQSFINSTATQ
ncbi:MAG: hypothetical protein ACR2O8_06795 [Rhizobiaceae bacterium]